MWKLIDRQIFKHTIVVIGLILSTALVDSPFYVSPLFAEPRAWSDDRTGYAIGGFDPLSYFVLGDAKRGRSNFEHAWKGNIWKFSNEGNRIVFQRHPEVYSPGFGGYDPYALSRLTLTEGLPTIWSVYRGKVYLFFSAFNRRLWLENEKENFEKARIFWVLQR